MSSTFQKRQKELKRQEKQRAKAERREQRKVAKRAEEAQPEPAAMSARLHRGVGPEASGQVELAERFPESNPQDGGES
jgi:hypothetical protein